MKYRITGSNRDTGARMTLEFEAESKAAAERKALQSGMNVNHVQDITDQEDSESAPDDASARRATRRGGSSEGGAAARLLAMLIFVAVAAALVWFFWGKIKPLIGK